MKKLIVALLFIFMVITTQGVQAVSEHNPDWITGTLCFNAAMHGETDKLVRDTCVIFMDFDSDQILSTIVPDDAELVENFSEGGKPAIVYQRGTEAGMQIAELQNLNGQYRFVEGYNEMFWDLGGISTANLLDVFGVQVCFETDPISRFVYCTRYSHIGSNNDLICAVRKEPVDMRGRREHAFTTHSWPAEDTIKTMARNDMWYVDVSTKGLYAISSRNSILVSDGSVEYSLTISEQECVEGIGWCDEDTLLVAKSDLTPKDNMLNGELELCMWNVVEKEITPIHTSDGDPFRLNYCSFEDIAVNEEGTLGAMLYTTELDGRMMISLLQIETGEIFTFAATQHSERNQEFVDYYGETDDGVQYEEPCEQIDSTLLWVAE